MQIIKSIKKLKKRLKKHLSVKRNKRRLYYITSSFVIILLTFGYITSIVQANSQADYQTKSLQSAYKRLQAVEKQKAVGDKQIKEKATTEAKLRSQIKSLRQKLQAKRDRESFLAKALNVVTATASVSAAPLPVGDAKSFIYMHESGNNPNATNPNGCYGLGQDCSGAVRSQCGANYACQDRWFTNYCMSRYGSWENAVGFWQGHGWW